MKNTILKLGLTFVLAATLVVLLALLSVDRPVAAPLESRLLDDHPDGATISTFQTTSGTWGPGTLTATTDISITSGVIITIAPGTTIQISTTDNLNLSIDPDRIEILVSDGAELRVNGPVIFTSQATAPAPGDWRGIRFLEGSSGWVDDAIIEYATRALVLNTPNPVAVTDSHLRYNWNAPDPDGNANAAGLYLVEGNHLISNTRIYSNTAQATGSGEVRGAGICIRGGSPHIVNSWIYENTAIGESKGCGGGICVRGGGALIESSYVLTNTLTGGGTSLKTGGGIGFVGTTTAVIRDTWIAGNRNVPTSGNAGGGGIGLDGTSSAALVWGSVIYNNYVEAPNWCEGGGIDTWSTGDSVTVNNNLIIDNGLGDCDGRLGGGAVLNGSATGTHFVNNTIVGNQAFRGGGLALQAGNVAALNNIVANNSATDRGGGIYRLGGTADYNDIFGNAGSQTYGAMGANNIYVDPLFIGTGDLVQRYHLRLGSPAIDAGTSTGTGIPNDDYDSDGRPAFSTWDIGYDEVPDSATPFAVLKHSAPDPSVGFFAVGEPLSYVINVANNGAATASGRITDVLPLNTTYSSDPTCSIGTCGYDNGLNAITWTGSIAPGGLLSLDYTVQVDMPLSDGTVITNTATVLMGAQIGTTNVAATTVYNPILTVAKTHEPNRPSIGSEFDFVITVDNSGSLGATNVVVTDVLPTGANYVSGGSLVDSNITWSIPAIAPNSSEAVTFTVWTCETSLTNGLYRVVTSTQEVNTPLGVPDIVNLDPPDLRASFAREPSVLESGPSVVNVGTSVLFTETTWTDGGPIVEQAWDFGDNAVASGPTTSHVYDTPGTFAASLTVTDVCGFSDSTSRTIIVRVPELNIAKSAEPEPVELGEVLSYTLVISNTGLGDATGLTVSDTLPAGTSYVTGSSQVTLPVRQSATFRDELRSVAYDGSDGTANWSTRPWSEINDDGDPTNGNVLVTSDLGDNSIRIAQRNRGLRRQVDLSGYTSALLAFDYRRESFNDVTDYVNIELSDDGGASWVLLESFAGPAQDDDYRPAIYDITSYISSTTAIRFISSSTMGGGDRFFVDNVHIEGSDYQLSTSPGGTPPALISGATLNAGQRMTVTFAVTANEPWTGGLVFTNTASVTSTQVGAPTTDQAISSIDFVPVLSIDKEGPLVAAVDSTVVYTFTVSHDAASDGSSVSDVEVTDSIAGAASYDSGDDGDGLLEADETWVYKASYTIKPTDPDPLINIGTVSGQDLNGDPVTGSDGHSTAIGIAPFLTLTKDGPTTAAEGATVVYTFTIAHSALSDGTPVSSITVTDTIAGEASYDEGDADQDGSLESGETWVYKASYTIQSTDPDTLVNVGTVRGQDREGGVITANDTHTTTVTRCIPVSGASITYTPAAPQVGQTIHFTGTVTAGSPPLTYAWDFGDGTSGQGATVVHRYTSVLTYTVQMAANSGCDGSFDVARIELPVTKRFIFLPVVLRNQ